MNNSLTTLSRNLETAFPDYKMQISQGSDYFIVLNSNDVAKTKIRKIIESIDFFPLIGRHLESKNICFTVVPYSLPVFFNSTEKKTVYFSSKEIVELFNPFRYEVKHNNPSHICHVINETRLLVQPALNQLLTKIIYDYVEYDGPIIEIGSGKGYVLGKEVTERVFRTQMFADQCEVFAQETTEPIYELSIQRLHELLKTKEKKIPLFFALKVFDTMNQEERIKNLLELAGLQEPGDKLIILLDSPPCIGDSLIKDLDAEFPGSSFYPLYPETAQKIQPLSLLVVPNGLIKEQKPDGLMLNKIMIEESEHLRQTGVLSDKQKHLQELQVQHHLRSIDLVKFYFFLMKTALKAAGYHTSSYYDASFVQNSQKSEFPLVYKSVSETFPLRGWSIGDDIRSWLKIRDVHLPNHYNEKFSETYSVNEHIQGAEIFVIEATKMR